MAARCATEAFSTTCAVHIEDCGGWWLSGCCGSVAEHWQLKPEVSWVRLPATAGFFTFLYFRLITSKFIYFQREARCSEQNWLSQAQRGRSCIRVKTAIRAEAAKVAEGYRAVNGLSKQCRQRSNEESIHFMVNSGSRKGRVEYRPPGWVVCSQTVVSC